MNLIGLFCASLIVSIGTFWAFQKGANDFSVFYEAWQLVHSGRGMEIYQATPDRFLYAPGFAWIFSPLALLPKSIALALWCFAKAGVVGLILKEFSKKVPLGIACWAVVFVARPFLIDFQYGQVNTFILGACVWALSAHFRECSELEKIVSWMMFAIFAIAKIFPLPLILIPFLKGKKSEKIGIVIGVLLMLVAPMVSQGFSGTARLMSNWKQALIARGLPEESHNQSFSAFLHHYFTASTTHVISEGPLPLFIGHAWISEQNVALVSLAWTLCAMGFLLAWLITGPERIYRWQEWTAVAIALLIVPSHLVWKPYFVMSLPVAIFALNGARGFDWFWLAITFAGINLTGFDFAGHFYAPRLEAAAILLFMHLILIFRVIARSENSRIFAA